MDDKKAPQEAGQVKYESHTMNETWVALMELTFREIVRAGRAGATSPEMLTAIRENLIAVNDYYSQEQPKLTFNMKAVPRFST